MNKVGFSRKIYGLFFLIYALLMSCSRAEQNSVINFSFSDQNTAQSLSYEMSVVFVNIGAQVLAWDCEKTGCKDISFETLSGDQRFLQIMVVAKETDSTTGNSVEKIFYSGKAYKLAAGDNVISPELEEIASLEGNGQLSAHYVATQGELQGKILTGEVEVMVQPKASHPAMRLMKISMFASYVNVFLTSNFGFYYKFTGHDSSGKNYYKDVPIFQDLHDSTGLKLGSTSLNANGNTVVRYDLSAGSYWERWDTNVYKQRDFEEKIFGFLGLNTAGRYFCADFDPVGLSFDGESGRDQLCSNSTCSAYYDWSDVLVSGSVDGSSDRCSSAAGLDLDLLQVTSYDQALNQKAAFLGTSFPSKVKALAYDEATYTFKWRFAPSVFLPEGFDLFMRSSNQDFDRDSVRVPASDGIDCSLLKDHGFSLVGSFGKPASPFQGSYTVPATLRSGSETHAAFCFKKPEGGYFQGSFIREIYDNGSQGIPVGLNIAKHHKVDGFTGIMFDNTCYPVLLTLVDQRGYKTKSTIPYEVNLNASTGSFYKTDGYCSSQTNAITNLELHDKKVLYYRHANTSGSGSFSVQATGLNSGQFSFTAADSSAATVTALKVLPSFYREALEVTTDDTCFPIQVAAFATVGGGLEMVSFASPFNHAAMASSNGGSFNLFADSACITAPLTGALNVPNGSGTFWVGGAYSGATDLSGVIQAASLPCTGGVTCHDGPIQAVAPANFSHIALQGRTLGPYSSGGDCVEIEIASRDDSANANFIAFPFGSSFNFSVATSIAAATFYSAGSCASLSSPVGAGNLPSTNTQTTQKVFLDFSSASSGYHYIDITDPNGENYRYYFEVR